jgi:hypothetical protein
MHAVSEVESLLVYQDARDDNRHFLVYVIQHPSLATLKDSYLS